MTTPQQARDRSIIALGFMTLAGFTAGLSAATERYFSMVLLIGLSGFYLYLGATYMMQWKTDTTTEDVL